MRATLLGVALIFAALPANARAASEAQIGAAERAEHERWEADTAVWMEEHKRAAVELSALATRLRSSEHDLARYQQTLKAHEATLGDHVSEPPAALQRHMAMRSAHEDMRRRHADILQAIAVLKLTVDRDDDTGTPRR